VGHQLLRIEFTTRAFIIFCAILFGLDALFLLGSFQALSDQATAPLLGQYRHLVFFIKRHLDLTTEGVVATWYSSALLLLAGLVALTNIRIDGVSAWLKWLNRVGWLLLGLVLIALSADEIAQIHESLGPLLNSMEYPPRHVIGPGDWIPILLPFIVATAVFMIAFFLLVVRKSLVALALSLAGVGCWVGAILSESIEAGFWKADVSRQWRGTVEEGFEVIGTSLLLVGFIQFHRRSLTATQCVAITEEPAQEAERPIEGSPSLDTTSTDDVREQISG
jgi:hypothetical protein